MNFYPGIDTSENNGLRFDGKAARLAGVRVWYPRCTVGWARRDPAYLPAKREAEENGICLGPYGLNWPANRNPKREAQYLASKVTDPTSPALPDFVVGDFELGVRPDASGNHLISGDELLAQACVWLETAEAELGIPALMYTGRWWLTDAKTGPFLQKYAARLRKFAPILAEYPMQGWGRLGTSLPDVYPDTFDPWSIEPNLPRYPNLKGLPWTADEVAGWQWSSLGKQQGIAFNRPPWDRLDYNVFYRLPGEPLAPPPPTLEERVADLERRMLVVEAHHE